MTGRFLIVFWVTGNCNLDCAYCYASHERNCRDMQFETAREILDRMEDYPLKIQFSGGEPLLNFGLIEQICEYVKGKGLKAVFQMQTNGTLIDGTLAKRLKALQISVGISLDGIPEINNLTRGKTPEAINGIRILGTHGMLVGLNAVVTAHNVDALEKLVDFALYLGNVGGIGLDLLRSAGEGVQAYDALQISGDRLRAALIKMEGRREELYRLSGRKIEIREIEQAKKRLEGKTQNKNYCYASCGKSIVVLPDGRLYPCGSLLEEGYLMGTAKDFCVDRIKALACEVPKACSGCSYDLVCPKGCPSRRICNRNTLDCVLLQTAFEIAKRSKAWSV